MLSNSQIDKIGKKLRNDNVDAECVRALELFRASFVDTYTYVEDMLVNKLRLKITGRPSKSTVAIVEKLKRETIRLSQIQDVAGCRVLVSDIALQNRVIELASLVFGDADIDDKRDKPTNGYRAVHLIVKRRGRPVEIQVRTRFQHAWAEMSEKISDAFGQSIKYGSGAEWAVKFLSDLSKATGRLEMAEHEKMVISELKAQQGSSRALNERNKEQNRFEREATREIRSLFAGLNKQF